MERRGAERYRRLAERLELHRTGRVEELVRRYYEMLDRLSSLSRGRLRRARR